MSEVDFPKWICHNQSQARKGWLKKHAGTAAGPNIWRGGTNIDCLFLYGQKIEGMYTHAIISFPRSFLAVNHHNNKCECTVAQLHHQALT